MSLPYALSFRKDVVLDESDGCLTLKSPAGNITLKNLRAGQRQAIRLLATGGMTEHQLNETAMEIDGLAAMMDAPFSSFLKKFDEFGLICYSIIQDGKPLATLSAFSADYRFTFQPVGAESKLQLSRFAHIHREGDRLVLESPLSHSRLELFGWQAAALMGGLSTARTVAELSAEIPGFGETVMVEAVNLLNSSAMIVEIDPVTGVNPEEANPTLRQWAFQDLLFHARTRLGRHANPVGGTYPFLESIPALPAIKPKFPGAKITLYCPDLAFLSQTDLTLTQALETRATNKQFDEENPITVTQLGEFLYRVARIKGILPPNPANNIHYETVNRVYPSGGAAHELEFYVLAHACQGLESGVYHYEADVHQLCQISGRTPPMDAMLAHAKRANGQVTPQVLIVFGARFQRMAWKYESIVYSNILKHVGCVFQTMYLVATAMGLAPCAIGNGNSDVFTQAVGTDYLVESSVGEFMLGSLGKR